MDCACYPHLQRYLLYEFGFLNIRRNIFRLLFVVVVV